MAAPMKDMGAMATDTYLIRFANVNQNFWIQELKAITELYNVEVFWNKSEDNIQTPFLVVNLACESHAQLILSRSVCIRDMHHLWAVGNTYQELYTNLRETPSEIKTPYFGAEKTFKFNFDAFDKKLTNSYKQDKIRSLPEDVLPFEGKVKLNNPDYTFSILEDYDRNQDGNSVNPSVSAEQPSKIYFGRLIGEGQRELLNKYHLQNRLFIANTSMDAGLALLMSNMAKVKENDLAFDPFVGSGSILVACAHHKAYVMGTDIDYMLIHAKARPSRAKVKQREENESIRANLAQYDLEKYYLDAMVADSSRHDMWHTTSMLDAIVTDPPYGIREKTEKIGTSVKNLSLTEEHKVGHFPQKVSYELADIFMDLLNFAAKFLRIGGRLVYWIPVYKEDYCEENIPTHPSLRLVANSEQSLTTKSARRLITMEKVAEFKEGCDKHQATIGVNHYEERNFHNKYFNKSVGQKSSTNTPSKYSLDSEDQMSDISRLTEEAHCDDCEGDNSRTNVIHGNQERGDNSIPCDATKLNLDTKCTISDTNVVDRTHKQNENSDT